jgi:hypothetical protein
VVTAQYLEKAAASTLCKRSLKPCFAVFSAITDNHVFAVTKAYEYC